MEREIVKLLEYIKESQRIVFFGGAGVSTESGIPDFRSKDGLYNQHDVKFDAYSPEYLLSNDCLLRHPRVFYEFYRQKMDTRQIQPNITHQVLARLEEAGKLFAVVTQNIDGLHQRAGSRRVYEIHGTTQKNYCMNCGKSYGSNAIFDSAEAIPRCSCGGQIRPEVTLYGESLPDCADDAVRAICNADMLIVGGTSLRVQPAAGFIYGFRGKHMAVINKEPLGLELRPERDVCIVGSLGDVFREIDRHWDELA